MSDSKPRTGRLNGKKDTSGWVAVAVVAAGGLLGIWVAYERGAATMDVRLTAIEERMLKEDTHTRLTKIEVKLNHVAAKDHNHRKK